MFRIRTCGRLRRHSSPGATRVEHLSDARPFEFSPWGTGALSVDGVERVAVTRPLLAILGRGSRIDIPAGEHGLDVTSCAEAGRNGFYLVRR